MTRKRTSYNPGHIAKFMVVVDDTPECERAIQFAARRVKRTGLRLVMLAVAQVEGGEDQALFGVGDVMRAEAKAEARAKLDAAADKIMKMTGVEPELVVREGKIADAVMTHIDEDPDVSILILGAGTGKDGPGPLVTNLSRTAGSFPIPVAVVPGMLSDEEIEALA